MSQVLSVDRRCFFVFCWRRHDRPPFRQRFVQLGLDLAIFARFLSPAEVDLGHSAYERLGISRDGDQRSELMSITTPKRVRILDGVTDPLGGSRKNLLSARNGISQIAEDLQQRNWLPTLDAIRTLVPEDGVCSNATSLFFVKYTGTKRRLIQAGHPGWMHLEL